MSYGQGPGYGYGPGPHYQQAPHTPGMPMGPGMPMLPREHPSSTTAIVLALAGMFCLGAILGVPAIITGRGALAAIAKEPHRWKGAGTAKAAVVIGWISVVETAFFGSMLLTQGWATAVPGIALPLIGLTLLTLSSSKGLPQPLANFAGLLRRAPLAVGLSLGGVLLGSSFGIMASIGKERVLAAACADAKTKYAAAAKTDDLVATRTAIETLERACTPSQPEVAKMRADLAAKEEDARKRREEAERERLAKLAAEKEKNAVETFPARSKEIAATIAAAQTKVFQGKVEAASDDLDGAQHRLDEFKGTSIEQSKVFTDLVSQLAEKKKAIQPQIDRIVEARRKAEAAAEEKRLKAEAAAEEKQRKEEAAAALKAEIRGEAPKNSPWDGEVWQVKSYLKTVMNDPDSYQHVRTGPVTGEGDYWVVTSSFRGKNAFGGLIINTKKFYIQQGEVVKATDP